MLSKSDSSRLSRSVRTGTRLTAVKGHEVLLVGGRASGRAASQRPLLAGRAAARSTGSRSPARVFSVTSLAADARGMRQSGMGFTPEQQRALRNAFVGGIAAALLPWLGFMALIVLSILPQDGVPRMILGAWVLTIGLSLVVPDPKRRVFPRLDQDSRRMLRILFAPVYPALRVAAVCRALLRGRRAE